MHRFVALEVKVKRYSGLLLCLSFVVFTASPSRADDILELNRSFIEKYKNRLTISAQYFVDAAHKKPNPGSKDRDMHVAGRASEIGLATVAEIQNAKSVPAAVDAIHVRQETSA